MPEVDGYYRVVPDRRPQLSVEEEATLFNAYRKRRTKKLRDRIVSQYLYWAAELACRYCGPRFSKPEAISAANFGLMQAIEEYDPACGKRFVWRSFLAIRRAIIDVMRTESYVVNPYPQLNAHKYVFQKTGRTEEGRKVLAAERAKVFESVNEIRSIERQDEEAMPDETDVVASIERTQMLEFLRTRLSDLNPQERRIVELRYFGTDTPTFLSIGKKMRLKKAYVWYIHDQAIKKLRKGLRKEL